LDIALLAFLSIVAQECKKNPKETIIKKLIKYYIFQLNIEYIFIL